MTLLKRLAAANNRLDGSAAQRAVEAVELIEAGAAPGKLTIADAAALRQVSIASVKTVLHASARDRLALAAGAASIRSIRRSSAPVRPQPGLLDLWRTAPDADRCALLRSLDPILLADLVAVRSPPKPNGHIHPTAA